MPGSAERSGSVSGRGERGAILLHVALALIGLLAVATLVVDYGVMWASRRQAQNAADAAALSAAWALSHEGPNDEDLARAAAVATATANPVWGQAPAIDPDTDVTFAPCPPGAPGLPDTCVRTDVFRNQDRENPLPVFFGLVLGLTNQGVRATATAQLVSSNRTNCMRPWFIPDKWVEQFPDSEPWSMDDTYDRYKKNSYPELIGPADSVDFYDPASGFDPTVETGFRVVLKQGSPHQTLAAGWYFPADLPIPGGPDTGGDRYRENIIHCNTYEDVIAGVTELWVENGNMVGPTAQGVEELVAENNPELEWVESLKCPTPFGVSDPAQCNFATGRIVPIPVFNIEEYYAGDKRSGKFKLKVEKIVCFFVEPLGPGGDVTGYLTTCQPSLTGGNANDPSSFLRTVVLVR